MGLYKETNVFALYLVLYIMCNSHAPMTYACHAYVVS